MNTILFDLDGTLLPMDQEQFIQAYFGGIAKKGATIGLHPDNLIKAVWAGTKAMVANQGTKTNEDMFWDTFGQIIGDLSRSTAPIFEDFYHNEFHQVKALTRPHPLVPTIIATLKQKGYQLILATNPLFPRIATKARIEWAGLHETDFAYITTYENSSYAKPNLAYYEQILQINDLQPQNCMMIGNDVKEDMVVSQLGIRTFLLDHCLIHSHEHDSNQFVKGNFDDLMVLIQGLPDLQRA